MYNAFLWEVGNNMQINQRRSPKQCYPIKSSDHCKDDLWGKMNAVIVS